MKPIWKFFAIVSLLAATPTLPTAAADAPALTLLNTDFQDDTSDGWMPGGQGDATLFNYQVNWSIRMTQRAEATNSVRIDGVSHVTLQASFAGYHLDTHDKCVAEYSIDNGSTWSDFFTLRPSQADTALHAGHVSDVDVSNTKLLLLRLRVSLTMHEGACFADNISVTGEPVAAH